MTDEKKTETKNPVSRETRPATQAVSPLRSLFPGFDRDFDDFFNFRWPRFAGLPALMEMPGMGGAQGMSVDVLDREADVCVRAELPGYRKEDIDVSLLNNTITIKATLSKDNSSEDGDYHRREIVRGSVSRTVSLPAEVETDQAKAELKDGVLEVILPKSRRSPRQKVEISG